MAHMKLNSETAVISLIHLLNTQVKAEKLIFLLKVIINVPFAKHPFQLNHIPVLRCIKIKGAFGRPAVGQVTISEAGWSGINPLLLLPALHGMLGQTVNCSINKMKEFGITLLIVGL